MTITAVDTDDEWPTETCAARGCGARIIKATTPAGKTMPVNPRPEPGGTVKLWRMNDQIRCSVVTAKLAFGAAGLHKVHPCLWNGRHRRNSEAPTK